MSNRKEPTFWARAKAAATVFRLGLEVRDVKVERRIGVLTPETEHETHTRLIQQLPALLNFYGAVTFEAEVIPGNTSFATKVKHTASVKTLLPIKEKEATK